MMRAAGILLALFALCVPAAVQAQEDEPFTTATVREALKGFGYSLLTGSCLRGIPPPLKVAVVQMEDSTKFEGDEAEIITDRVEQALSADPGFKVLQRREKAVLEYMAKVLGESKSRDAAGEKLDALIRITPEGGHSVNVIAYALLPSGELCEGRASRPIKVGTIERDADKPGRLFERAAGKLYGSKNDHDVKRLVVMPPELVGLNGMAGRVMGRRLLEQMVNAINKVFQEKAILSMTGAPTSSVAEFYNGTDVPDAWQGYLHLGRASDQLISVRIEFRGQQGGAPVSVSDHGYFAMIVLPPDSDPEVDACNKVKADLDRTVGPDALRDMIQRNACPSLRDDIVKQEARYRAEAACKRVQLERDAATDPATLEALAQKNECPRLHDAILEKAVSLRNQAVCDRVRSAYESTTDPDALTDLVQRNECPSQRDRIAAKIDRLKKQICDDDQAHWRRAAGGSLEAMESTLRTLRCPQVRDAAEHEVSIRREHEAEIERLKAAAADLGVLQDGEAAPRNSRAGGDDSTGVWKFEITEADTVEIQVDDPDGALTVELRDASWRLIATARQSGPHGKGIESSRLASSATYYILVRPSEPKHDVAYTLRAARGFIDGVGNTPDGAQDLGALGQHSIRKHVGGSDSGDFFRFTAKERSQVILTMGDLTSNVRVELLNQNQQRVETWSYRPGQPQSRTPIVEAGAVYYLHVAPDGPVTLYALGIALSPYAAPVHATQNEAADITLGGSPNPFTWPASQSSYWAKFRLLRPTTVRFDLRSDAPPNEFRLSYSFGSFPGAFQLQPGRDTPLAKGEYLVHVERIGGGTGAVQFSLSMQQR